ncbi:hypothetical protein [Mycolicibacterium conceptionense]|uniref:hypothetical protein n=1 Tax=Mycolicibacterium conceptionense TaxID=451644 RepID=UPI00096C90A0|nr:hypothetical protein [Mycolicibacterium conceptionense]OMB79301.1 hypothetical protein A5743_14480 [Mycolicibacterium conceptionense]
MNKLLAVFASLLAKALFEQAVAYLKNPENRDDIEDATRFVLERATSATPWTWDDRAVRLLADALSAKIPGLDGLGAAVQQLQRLIRNPIDGLLGGGR